MRALFGALVAGYVRANRLRSLITVIAVALGVAIALAIDLANHTAVASFAASVNVVSNHVNLQVLGLGAGFDERVLTRVDAVDGITYAAPAIEDSVVVGARRGDPLSGEILRVLGVDMLRPVGGAATAFAQSGVAGLAASAPDPDELVNAHGAIVSARILRAYHLRRGGPLDALAGDRPVRLRVSGVFPEGTGAIDSSVVFVDVATAQEMFGKVGRLDRIDVIADPARLAAVSARIRAVLPPGVRAIEPRVRTSEIARMLRSFQLNLAALSYVALLVGAYLIYNTVAISVVQRRPEIGIVRALGATRRQIFATFIVEGALLGASGSLLGCAIGSALAQLAVGAVSRTVDTLYVGSHADRVVYDPLLFGKALLAGLALAVISAVAPALEAAFTAPAAAMRSAGFEGRSRRAAPLLGMAGALLLIAAYAATFAPAIDGIPVFGYLAGLLILFGMSLLTPLLVSAVSRVAGALLARGAPEAHLAAGNLRRSLFRTSVAAASLMVAVGMMVSVAILIGSFRTTVVAWANDTITADIFVRPLGLQDASYDARFSPAVVRRIAAARGIAAIDTLRAITIPYRGRLTTLAATDFTSLATRSKLRFLDGADARALGRTLPGSTGVVVSEPFATRFAARAGDVIPLDTPSGPVRFTIQAIYNDYSSDAGIIIADARTFARLYHDTSVNSIAIYAQPGTDLAALRTRVIRSALPAQIDAQTSRELRSFVITIFNRTFAITYALYIISITIAVLGVISTLFALVLERRREIGILRYLGLATAGVRRMVYVEAALLGGIGGCAGVAAGVLLSLLLIFVINRQAFGWLIELHVPYGFLLEAVLLIVAAALAAGIYPANVAARIATAEAVRAE